METQQNVCKKHKGKDMSPHCHHKAQRDHCYREGQGKKAKGVCRHTGRLPPPPKAVPMFLSPIP